MTWLSDGSDRPHGAANVPKIRKFPIGGTPLPEVKDLTTGRPIEWMSVSGDPVRIPLRQHLGEPAVPRVKPGETVRRGQLIGAPVPTLGAAVHASVSGRVLGLSECRLADGARERAVVIAPDTHDREDEYRLPPLDLNSLDGPDFAAAVRDRVREAGIVGLGGAGFPTHLKLSPMHPIDTVIVNGAECEPYITVDDRIMQEQADLLCRGLDLIRRTVGAARGLIACEINKPAALETLRSAATRYPGIDAVALDTRYPHGAEKHLIKAVLNREVPLRALPGSVGVLVNNVQTVTAIAEAVDLGRTLHSRVVTVSGGGVREPKNLRIPLGVSVRAAIAFCGGATVEAPLTIVGGPMTGTRIDNLDVPVIKSTSGIILLTEAEAAHGKCTACIRCGKCVEVCPMYLPPNRITAYLNQSMQDEALEAGLDACILCGACQYVCPSKRPLLAWLRQGRARIRAGRRTP